MTKGLIDCHTHSLYSPDGQEHINRLCTRAYELSLRAYAVTDHCECNAYVRDGYDRRIRAAAQEVALQKQQYEGRMEVLAGIELGQVMQDESAAADAVDAFPYDVVLCSLHNIARYKDFAFFTCGEALAKILLRQYYEELLQSVRWGRFQVLTHLTYPLRYVAGEQGVHVDFSAYRDLVAEILRTLAQTGKALEINTSGLRQKLGETMPPLEIVKLFREVGGEYVSLGSDAHKLEHVGAGIAQGAALAQEAGFSYVTYFKQKQPCPVPI